MSKKVKSFEEGQKEVSEMIGKINEINQNMPDELKEQIPSEVFDKVSDMATQILGGEGFEKLLSEFLDTFKVLSVNSELNTTGIATLNKNFKWLKWKMDQMEKNQNSIMNSIGQLIQSFDLIHDNQLEL